MTTNKNKKGNKNTAAMTVVKEAEAGLINLNLAKRDNELTGRDANATERGKSAVKDSDIAAKKKNSENSTNRERPQDPLHIDHLNRVKRHHDPLFWRSAGDLIIAAEPQIKYIGSTSKINRALPKSDEDVAVYETVETKAVIASNIGSGTIWSVPDHLSAKFSYGDRVIFDRRGAKELDYDKEKRFLIVPTHAVIAVVMDLAITEVPTTQRATTSDTNKNGENKTYIKLRNNPFGRLMQRLRFWLGGPNVSGK